MIKKLINRNHLFWVVPLMLLIGLSFGIYIGIPKHIDVEIDYGDNIISFMEFADNIINNSSNQVAPIWACHDGCIFAEWYLYGGRGALDKQSELYTNCTNECWKEYEREFAPCQQ